MPSFELKPVDGGNLVHLPEGETVLGRGPLFGVNDKRVSRNHGMLENAEGKLRIKPTHLNPCFVQSSLESPPQPLKKGQWYTLDPGDLLSLLPGKYIYCVVAKEEEEEKEEEEKEKEKEEDESTIRNSQNLCDDEKGESDGDGVVSGEAKTSCSAPPSANETPDVSTLPYRGGGVSVSQQSTLVPSLEGRGSADLPPSSPVGDLACDTGVAEHQDGGDETCVPPQRTRTLPAWMMAGSSGEVSGPSIPKATGKKGPAKAAATTPKPKPNSKAAAVSTPSRATQKRVRTRVVSSEEEAAAVDDDEEREEEEEEEEEEEIKAAAVPPRPVVRPTRQAAPARGEMSDESDSMEVGLAMEDEEQQVEEKSRGRAPEATTASVTSTGSTEGSDSHKRNNNNKPSSQNGHGASQVASEAKSKETTAGRGSVKKTPRRTPCPYGSSCYRKNPVHFQECSHPEDSDYEEEAEEEEVDEEDDDRPECPYGTDCYRKNPLHKKEYKHTRPPARTSASRKDDEDDDDEETYDDSFINDDSEEAVDKDSDYVPEDSGDSGKEDVKRLQKEAKAFLRRKK
ncbi:aprataxin and PNK-like factor isoform X2 [Alosa sapidissima]|uniref:aprataxin and PNK-like factor isoform X2 n=1 Tax=Alosa sapidissima TaxID=34773 RepID=UPI001C09B99F|nr:aprataxin and PNK-like factor isoform X2 [Alosa sapidissima]